MRPHGIDISKWNNTYSPKESPRPVDFVIQRTSYGLVRDQKYYEFKPIVTGLPIKGVYHYASSACGWKDQCDFFLELMDGYDFWAWDVEKAYNSDGVAQNVITCMEYLTRYSGKPGLLYTNPDMWGTWFRPYQADLLKYDLWVAHYWWIPNPEGKPNYFTIRGAESMRKDWKFWQYDKNGMNGRGYEFGVGSKGLDLNVFNGTLEELITWVHPEQIKYCPTCGQKLP